MKRFFVLAAAMCTVAFFGCSKEEESGSLVISGVNVAGTWALIGDVWDSSLYYDDNDELHCTWQEGQKVEDLIVFTSNTIRMYSPTERKGSAK